MAGPLPIGGVRDSPDACGGIPQGKLQQVVVLTSQGNPMAKAIHSNALRILAHVATRPSGTEERTEGCRMGGGLAVEIGRLCLGLVGGADGCARKVADVAEASAAALRSAGQAPERLFERVVAEHRGAWASAMAQSRDRSAIEAVEKALTEGLGRAFDRGEAIVPVEEPDLTRRWTLSWSASG